MKDFLCDECRNHYQKLKEYLALFQIAFREDGRLVRGLDYYTKTAFELTSTELGSQDALAGGGRYDLLTAELGGKPTPGVGFAAGIERLLMVLEKREIPGYASEQPSLYIAAADDASRDWALARTMEMRNNGVSAESDLLGRSLKAQMRDADRQGAAAVVVVGQQELQSGKANLKNMKTGESKEILLDELGKNFAAGAR
jgi:histidyl-tRNA synthetase